LYGILVLLVITFAGIGGWLLNNVRRSRARADEYVQWAQAQKRARGFPVLPPSNSMQN
jgi:hypothetical protein